jgi:hypothetical protein
VKAIVTGGRGYEDNGALWFTLDCLRTFTWTSLDAWGRPAQPLSIAHGACGWDLAKDGSVPPQLESAAYMRFLRKLKGADKVAHLFALSRQLEVRCYPADWSKGPSGGPRRNQHMFHVEQPNVVVAAPGGSGTAGMSDIARGAGTMLLEVTPWRSGPPAPDICLKCQREVPATADWCVCEVF